jgi:hypothetical protein
LSSANLEGVDLTASDLRNADLSLANLQGANLSDAKLDHAILAGTLLDPNSPFYEPRQKLTWVYASSQDAAGPSAEGLETHEQDGASDDGSLPARDDGDGR